MLTAHLARTRGIAAKTLLATARPSTTAHGAIFFSTDSNNADVPRPQKQKQKQKQPRRTDGKRDNLRFADDEGKKNSNAPAVAVKSENAPSFPRKKKTFSFSKQKEPEVPLEVFEYPAYWNQDYPEGFDDEMKHEVEKLQIFADFTPLLDESWQKEIHPLFDGAAIELTLNCPLEDFDERLFIDDKNTYDTKVVMEVPLSCFHGLDKDAIEIVKQLAGPRYNANKKQLKLTEDRYNSRVFNHKRLCDILHDLTEAAHQESLKAKKQAAQA